MSKVHESCVPDFSAASAMRGMTDLKGVRSREGVDEDEDEEEEEEEEGEGA